MQDDNWPDANIEDTQAAAEQEPEAADQNNRQLLPFIEPDDDHIENNKGILTRLQETRLSAARRTVQRLHRNLRHPTNLELARVLTSLWRAPFYCWQWRSYCAGLRGA